MLLPLPRAFFALVERLMDEPERLRLAALPTPLLWPLARPALREPGSNAAFPGQLSVLWCTEQTPAAVSTPAKLTPGLPFLNGSTCHASWSDVDRAVMNPAAGCTIWCIVLVADILIALGQALLGRCSSL